MFIAADNETSTKTTSFLVVLPFYLYASLFLLLATIQLFFLILKLPDHYFQPSVMAITHSMALGWSTMVILGACHQLVPVLIETRLYSQVLAYITFLLAAAGIPLLVFGFRHFNMGWPSMSGAILINAAIVSYLVNLIVSISNSKTNNVHAVFIFTATLWLLLTTITGFLQVWNFTESVLPNGSLYYLPLHAHVGIVGWFLLLVMGVGSRLIPMFLISKYRNIKLLWLIYGLINGGLLIYIFFFLSHQQSAYNLLPVFAVLGAVCCFGFYCLKSFRLRIRTHVDQQMRYSLLSVILMFLPVICLFFIIGSILSGTVSQTLIMIYGFAVFFGWITSIILGMTFKTLPFIIWNKIYSQRAGTEKTPNPIDLFNGKLFKVMGLVYLSGFVLFIPGLYLNSLPLLYFASSLLLVAVVLYNINVFNLLFHNSSRS
jgi:hypothetical protein